MTRRTSPYPVHGPASLTPKERAYLVAILEHGSIGYAALHQGVQRKTVREAMIRVRAKLDCDTTLQAAVVYDRWVRAQSGERRVGERRQGDRRKAA